MPNRKPTWAKTFTTMAPSAFAGVILSQFAVLPFMNARLPVHVRPETFGLPVPAGMMLMGLKRSDIFFAPERDGQHRWEGQVTGQQYLAVREFFDHNLSTGGWHVIDDSDALKTDFARWITAERRQPQARVEVFVDASHTPSGTVDFLIRYYPSLGL